MADIIIISKMSDFFNLEPKIFLKKGISKPAHIPPQTPVSLILDPLCEKVKHFGKWFCASSSSRQYSPFVYEDRRGLGSWIFPRTPFF